MVALRVGMGLGVTEAEGGVADLRTANGKRLKHLQWHTTGKNSHFELNRPYLRLNVLSVALQEVADTSHPLQS